MGEGEWSLLVRWLVSTFTGDPLTRQLEEAIKIDHQEGISLNDKSEFIRPDGERISVTRM